MPAINAGRAAPKPRQSGSSMTSAHKVGIALVAVLIGPSLLKKFYDKPVDKVDLSAFNIVTSYDTPAIEKRDGTLRIEPLPAFVGQMHENKIAVAGGVYALDVVAQTFKSINAFELTYNGHVLHSKLNSGQFPEPAALVAKLREVMEMDETQPSAQPVD